VTRLGLTVYSFP